MKRLTSNVPLTEAEAMNLSVTNLYARLKEYEDTGLEPEDILTGLEMAYLFAELRKLDEVKKAEAEGRLPILPCKVGDEVYFLRHYFDGSAEIVQGEISMLQQKSDLSWKFRVSEGGSVFDRKMDDIGKTIFLTIDEAEAALRGCGNETAT